MRQNLAFMSALFRFATVIERLVRTPSGIAAKVAAVGPAIPFPDCHFLMHRETKRSVRPEVGLSERRLCDQFFQDAGTAVQMRR